MKNKTHKKDNFIEREFLSALFERLLDLKNKLDAGSDVSNSSLRNMNQYLNLRKYDFSALQDDLTKVGLSSFGRSQAHIEASVVVALRMLSLALNKEANFDAPSLSYEDSHAIMEKNGQIFSKNSDKTKIMITVPSEYHEDEKWFEKLYHEGVHLFRINTAHDTPEAWSDMASKIKKTHKELKIYVDLAGPKIRTVLLKSEKDKKIKLFYNDKLLIQSSASVPKSAKKSGYAAAIGCTLEKIGSMAKVGDPVFIDDGKIETIIEEIDGEDIICRVLTNNEKGSKLKDEKGINFPNSDIHLSAISQHDREILPSICAYADIIGISFAQEAKDVHELIEAIKELQKERKIAIVAKIETKKGVKNLPYILEALINYAYSGVMIARGDLAIEIGFENLAYMQEEILDLCSAAHMPVILATQVLESKMKTNLPSRAEISDVAFAHKAECVMLNKGAYAVETVQILKTIFSQMDLVFRKNKLLYSEGLYWRD